MHCSTTICIPVTGHKRIFTDEHYHKKVKRSLSVPGAALRARCTMAEIGLSLQLHTIRPPPPKNWKNPMDIHLYTEQ